MTMELEDVRFNHFQRSFVHENAYPFQDELCSQLIRSLQSIKRRKLSDIGNIEVYSAPKKFLPAVAEPKKSQPQEDRINALPEELLIEIFRFVSAPADRYACASVCMRWLMIQSHLQIKDEQKENCESGSGDELKRCLEGKRATDVRLALVAVGTQARGGLGKLIIKGGPRQNLSKAVSNIGISSVGIYCTNLQVLTVWDCPRIDDDGFSWIGKGCSQLKVLNIMNCPGFGDASLQAIAAGCPLLTSLSLDGCEKVGDPGLQSVGIHCSQLWYLSITDCKNVGDYGIENVVAKCRMLKALKLEKLGVRDDGLVAVGKHGSSLQKLKLLQLENVTSEGFFLFGRNSTMKQLKHLQVSTCPGLTDSFLDTIGKAHKELRFLSLVNCKMLDKSKLGTLVNECAFLESLHLEKCVLSGSDSTTSTGSQSLKVLSLVNCTGVENSFSSLCGSSFPSELDLSGVTGLSEASLVTFLATRGSALSSLNLSGCTKLTNTTLAAVASFCPSLGLLSLEGCLGVMDQGIQYLAQGPQPIQELNIAGCNITDNGIMALLATKGSALKTLSMAGCSRLTARSLLLMKQICKDLEALNVKECKGLSRAKLEWLESCLWRCQLCY